MVNKNEHYVEWVLLIQNLEDAKEHLENLIMSMIEQPDYEETDFQFDLAHVYNHLNRAWNSRHDINGIIYDQWDKYNQFPIDLNPTG